MTGPRRPSDIVQPTRPRPELAPPAEVPVQGQPSPEQVQQLLMVLMMMMQGGQGMAPQGAVTPPRPPELLGGVGG